MIVEKREKINHQNKNKKTTDFCIFP
jgi:hypothetical protein